MPDSPAIITARPVPVCTCAQRRNSNSSSSSRPTSGVSAVSCSASNRLPTAASFSTCQTCTGPGMPFNSTWPRSAQSNRRPICWRVDCVDDDAVVAGETLQAGGKIGRLTDRRLLSASPVPIISPITTRPVAMPIRSRSLSPPFGALADLADHSQCGAHSPLGIGLARFRPAEIDQHAVAHVARNEPAEALRSSWPQWPDSCGSPHSDPRGPRCEDSAVKPTTSQNITLIWRRSADSTREPVTIVGGTRQTAHRCAEFG